ncbi:uncharacterized protein TRIADDRAFT_54436 [Trichoplax adhaerens]|uniref:Ubiquitin-activating enzyme E1 C-terminal domain-containing protein n=1 Tax=Trichoplax adhaerens TaxID=10228 RepID=B3RS11_TRIAD|nr:hypothetical protein TRIADDRAFT_54436 [Trichoplax adhaerens]EDV26442.1 hypothetical protein TRIADDRAFT_54436 [Trichoplax adhaerens]|eukprot:XP_002110438.1 hypothetical protein TRIADDRAFT_54436 [Trichoplax adhaerens]
MATEVDIDDSFYSRQRYMLGDLAMRQLSKAKVFLSGLGGLGVEIAKNVTLAGVKGLTLHDVKNASVYDLGTQFYLNTENITKIENRAKASFQSISQLNPHVVVDVSTTPFNCESDLSFLLQYQCVVLTESPLELQVVVDQFCRSQDPPIAFISADVFGLFSFLFCDFGESFQVIDGDGEEPEEILLSNVSKDNPAVVKTIYGVRHGLTTGDYVKFREIKGMTALNNRIEQITVISPDEFTICDTTSDQFGSYANGGTCVRVKIPFNVQFEDLSTQFNKPDIAMTDFSKPEVNLQSIIALRALHTFNDGYKRMPRIRDTKDAEQVINIALSIIDSMITKVDKLDVDIVTQLAYTCQGCFQPLVATMGGIVGQEVLIALTNKYAPIKQWLCLETQSLFDGSKDNSMFLPRNDRYDGLRICIGNDICERLSKLRLFMVGCGAIGCEMLKNCALTGIATSVDGLMTITDHDLIEKSNLNRQFLFRESHIQKSKAVCSAEVTRVINPVGPSTETSVHCDSFFKTLHVVVNALDNVEARRYMDGRCVSNQRPLLDSGTTGPKGHVQVILPFETETYSDQRDANDETVIPYCTLKSFPARIEHTIQWARDKFESFMVHKPSTYSKFWSIHGQPNEIIEKLERNQSLQGIVVVAKLLNNRLHTWEDCIRIARIKFEKYFNHKARQLLDAFPLSATLSDGSLFWSSPKRPPAPLQFDVHNETHIAFIESTARLLADVYGLSYNQQLARISIPAIVADTVIPVYTKSNKEIVVDESVKKEEITKVETKIEKYIHDVNLRAMMYGIETVDRLKTKRIAGKIVPAIATTTATVAGLVTAELIKIVSQLPLNGYRNAFINLAIPLVLLSEPGPANKTAINDDISYTSWDRWDVVGDESFTLSQFIQWFKDHYKLTATAVMHGVKIIYMAVMPGHAKKRDQTMKKLLKLQSSVKSVELTVSFEDKYGDSVTTPPIRYSLS